jgi:hypothetical protein
MRKTTILLLVILTPCVWLAWVAYQSPLGRPDISVGFLGYTNEASGTRLAMIAVTNLSATTVHIGGGWILQPSPTEPKHTTRVIEQFWLRAMLNRGASIVFPIPPPTNQLAWKYLFDARNDIGFEQDLWYVLNGRLHQRDYVIESEWIDVKR